MALQFLAGTSKSDKKVEEKVKLFHTVHYGDKNYERKVNSASILENFSSSFKSDIFEKQY